MSVLVVVLPRRARGDAAPAEWRWVYSDDGATVRDSGRGGVATLPRADQRVLLLADDGVAWHLVDVPKAPAPRLAAALAGVLEEHLLDDPDDVHLALAAGVAPGQRGWVAATARAPLVAALEALESPAAGGRPVDRVVAALEPMPPAAPSGAALGPARRAHVHAPDMAAVAGGALEADVLRVAAAGPDGVADLALDGSLARAWLDEAGARGEAVAWSASPAAAAAAERWLGAPVPVREDAERWLEAAQRGSNLRQFVLAPRHRGSRALGALLRQFATPAWRPVRWGLGALLLVQLAGLNAAAWSERQRIAERKAAMTALLQSTHPGVRAVLDAPLQMQRETERLRAAAGRPGPADLEALLGVAAAAWPDGAGAAASLRFEPGRLVLAVPGWGEPQRQQFQQRLRGGGHRAEFVDGELRLAAPRPGEAR